MTLNLLIAEDAPDVAETIGFAVRMNWPGCHVTLAADGREALHYFEQEPIDLVILDISMPPPDGFEVCRCIRAHSTIPILMLTVHNNILDKMRAFDLGADDYLTKPFDHLELLARLRALVRRASFNHESAGDELVVGDLVVNEETHEVRVCGEAVQLTSTEYRLLRTLIHHAGTVVPHQTLLERIWGPEYTNDVHYLKVYVQRLRQKLGDDAETPRYIATEWGIGYRFIQRPQFSVNGRAQHRTTARGQ